MLGFYKKYPEFRNRELYLAGESFAGHYIPSIANYLYHTNVKIVRPDGIAIGNGWVDPFYQYETYPQYAYEKGIVTAGNAMVANIFYEFCQYSSIFRIPFLSTMICQFAGVSIATPGMPKFNMYDVRLPCEKLGTCYPDDHLSEVMNNYQYRDAMNIKGLNETWEMCATLPHLFMMGDFDSMMGWKLSTLLDNGMPVLIYNGDQDYLCNYRGGLRWTNALKWLG